MRLLEKFAYEGIVLQKFPHMQIFHMRMRNNHIYTNNCKYKWSMYVLININGQFMMRMSTFLVLYWVVEYRIIAFSTGRNFVMIEMGKSYVFSQSFSLLISLLFFFIHTFLVFPVLLNFVLQRNFFFLKIQQ